MGAEELLGLLRSQLPTMQEFVKKWERGSQLLLKLLRNRRPPDEAFWRQVRELTDWLTDHFYSAGFPYVDTDVRRPSPRDFIVVDAISKLSNLRSHLLGKDTQSIQDEEQDLSVQWQEAGKRVTRMSELLKTAVRARESELVAETKKVT